MSFVKQGNLQMINGLIKHFDLGPGILLLKGCSDEIQMGKTKKESMAEWNPFLTAIAFKQIEVVRYFLHELNISLRIAGR